MPSRRKDGYGCFETPRRQEEVILTTSPMQSRLPIFHERVVNSSVFNLLFFYDKSVAA